MLFHTKTSGRHPQGVCLLFFASDLSDLSDKSDPSDSSDRPNPKLTHPKSPNIQFFCVFLQLENNHYHFRIMAETKIAGVMRAGAYSPNHIGNDAAIFNVVAEQLRKRGCEVNIYSEEQFIAGAAQERIIINMCREARSVALLQRLEDDGALVINSGYGIENCTRERMTRILLGSNIPYPESIIVNTDQAIRERLDSTRMSPCWIKKAESHSMHKEDVSYARHTEEAQEVLQEYFLRGIKRAVINRHLPGDLIKFYGVADSPFFYWFYPLQEGHSKYGAEAINGMPTNLPFSVEKLRAICAKCSEVLDVKIYGGDCIVSPEGDIRIIDFNDWPSFAPCRAEAAPHIARHIMNAIKRHTAK